MKVNFNNLRKQAVNQANELSKQLSDAVIKDSQWAKPNDVRHAQDIDIQGYVLIDAEDVQSKIDNLQSLIRTIACVYEEGNEDFADLSEEIGEPVWFEND